VFKNNLDELKDAFMDRYKDMEDVKIALIELQICLNVDCKRFAIELDEYIKGIN